MLELRASKIGGCVRGYVMDLRAGKEPEPTPKARLYFAVGKALERTIMEHSGYNPDFLLNDKLEVRAEVNGEIVVVGHPDSIIEDWVIECKTMRTFAYKKMMNSSIFLQFPQYLVQGASYVQGSKTKGVIFLCLDKDASEIHRVRVEAWELAEYWEKAKANAEKIYKWLDKKNLPGKAEDLPPWHCLPTYCLRHDCRFNIINRKPYNPRTR